MTANERLLFIDAIGEALRLDHNQRHANGKEGGRFSRSRFESELARLYPRVGTSELLSTASKQAKQVKDDPYLNRGMDFEKVDGLLTYIFKDLGGHKYPTVAKLVKGEPELSKYAELVKTQEQKNIDHVFSVLNGAPEDQLSSTLLRLYVDVVTKEKTRTIKAMSKNENTIKELTQRLNRVVAILEKKIANLEGKQLTPEERKELEDAKRTLNQKK